ncbi:hypothetical protein ACIBCN_28060 [Nocardia sp. NPDC051052]|uniref:hypothetical protein n=1 Tax=Nocardia sp. NPDC051052 TaxID=3364322 RepID=UPI00378F31EF
MALIAVVIVGWIVVQRLIPGESTSSTGYVTDPEPHRPVAFDSLIGKSVQEVYTEIGYPDFTRGKYTIHLVPLDPSAANLDPADQIVSAVCGGYLSTQPTDVWFGVYSRAALPPEVGDRIRAHDKSLDAELLRAVPSCPAASSGIAGPAQ